MAMSGSLIQLGSAPPAPPVIEVHVTPAAREQILRIQRQSHQEGKALRLYVQGGGCSGLTYGMMFDEPTEADQRIEAGQNLTILVDPASAPLLNGVEIDFLLTLEASGFKIKNPNAKQTCSCGKSFA
jgi:iron-sulfur cluster assembly protein